MIEPQVEHGGASSWFWNACSAGFLACLAASASTGAGSAFGTRAITSSGSCSGVVGSSSRLFTPAWYCASTDRNFAASQRKM